MLPKYKEAQIIRSRDPAVIAQGSIVVDVGGEYLPEKLRFDHHQRGFNETFSKDHDIKLSSAGLIYKHYGKEIIAQILGLEIDHAHVELLFIKMYDEFVEAVCCSFSFFKTCSLMVSTMAYLNTLLILFPNTVTEPISHRALQT